MRLYRFSPIKTQDRLIKVVKYIAIQTTKLCNNVIGQTLPINSLTVFSHYHDEYEKLIKILTKMGDYYNENNGLRVRLKKPINVSGHSILFLRIRKPDPYRMQVGCNDFVVENYKTFKKGYLTKHTQNLRLIERPEYEMIEFFHPDFDVLAYIVHAKQGNLQMI